MVKRTFRLSGFVSRMTRVNQDVTLAPLEDVDFRLENPDQIIPGTHILPLRKNMMQSLMFEPVSPYMPSPHRVHPYFIKPVPELPHLKCSVPIVYPYGTIKVPIIIPVYSLEGDISHTREVDPYIFGMYPDSQTLFWGYDYWDRRCQNFVIQWDYELDEVFKSSKKEWPNAGTGRKRAGARKTSRYPWGARMSSVKPWKRYMPKQKPALWRLANSMAITTKMLQGKLQIVDKLSLSEPTKEAFLNLCHKMKWDVRHTGGGVLFIDGGSRLAPSKEYDRNFFYGSFINGKTKVMRPTIQCAEPLDWNKHSNRLSYLGPKGPKNPIPLNHFNVYDALTHDLLVITEGAVEQIERELVAPKYLNLPPHIRNQLPKEGGFELRNVLSIQDEVAGRLEEAEMSMYTGYEDSPYEIPAYKRSVANDSILLEESETGRNESASSRMQVGYDIDEADGVIRQSVDGVRSSWKLLK